MDDFQGFEDEQTIREVLGLNDDDDGNIQQQQQPFEYPAILVVSVAQLPVGADIEVEFVAVTCKATQYLQRTLYPRISMTIPWMPTWKDSIWKCDTGHDDLMLAKDEQDTPKPIINPTHLFVSSLVCTLGKGCAGL